MAQRYPAGDTAHGAVRGGEMRKLHTHPWMEKKLNVPENHCIVDRADWSDQNNANCCEMKLSQKTYEMIKTARKFAKEYTDSFKMSDKLSVDERIVKRHWESRLKAYNQVITAIDKDNKKG